MGYTPNHVAKSLVAKKTFTIGVVIPEITHSFFPEVIRGIEEITYKKDYHLILAHSAEKQERENGALKTLQSKRVDGILISSAQSVDNYDFYKKMAASDMPVVFFDRCVENIGISCVSINDEASSRQITEHLISHGYEKIAHLRGSKKISIGQKRLDGYLSALRKHQLPIKSEWIVESGFQERGGYEAMTKLLELPSSDRPEAIVAVNDPAAFGAMDKIYSCGYSIPDDFAIVGFTDDIRADLVRCSLTTVRQPAYAVGRKAAEKLIHTIENDDEPIENIELVTKLIFRKSCGCEKYFSIE